MLACELGCLRFRHGPNPTDWVSSQTYNPCVHAPAALQQIGPATRSTGQNGPPRFSLREQSSQQSAHQTTRYGTVSGVKGSTGFAQGRQPGSLHFFFPHETGSCPESLARPGSLPARAALVELLNTSRNDEGPRNVARPERFEVMHR